VLENAVMYTRLQYSDVRQRSAECLTSTVCNRAS